MDDWKTRLKANPIPWLLELDNPSVRYFTLTDLLDRSPEDPEICQARATIRTSPMVQTICAGQRRDGGWLGVDFYVPKGLATFWRLALLGDLGLTIAEARDLVRRACEFMFRHQSKDGCFRRVRRREGRLVRERADVPCTQARIVRALVQLGYGDDPRTKRAIAWLIHTQRDDGTWLCTGLNPRRGCLRATIDYLRAMELFPAMKHNTSTQRAAEFVASLLLQARMGRFHVSEAWTVFEFPYFNYSLIPTLLALLRLGMPADYPSIAPAIHYVLERQRDDGTWSLDVAPRAPVDLGRASEANKWLTLDALRMIKAGCE
jgi:hypothetical protein